ncbi:MAG: glycosyltransferase family 2 protein [Bacilli bacterium]|nr:glycosyltransferase family 2 protein [Bacilli bacterium]
MKISIVTATYNREGLLPKLYESLNKNYKTYKDFEWIIMDDGSEDNTKSLVEEWTRKAKYKIDYHYQKNAGKMKAINNGMKYVTGDIIIEVDSDDYLNDDALKTVNDDYEKLYNDNVYGIIYKRNIGSVDTTVDENINNKVIRLFDIHHKYGYDFDMTITFKADVRKKYDYILEKNEKFITEARTYYKMDQDYEGLLFINKGIVTGEYMEDGYSKNISEIFKKYPHGYFEYFKECLSYVNKDTMFKKRIYFIKHYILFGYLTHRKMSECIKCVNGFNKLLVMLLVIPGYIKSSKF